MNFGIRSANAALLLCVSSMCVFASDGVQEINQTCAENTGCFSGDSAGFPVTIDGTAGQSYLLTSDLSVTGVNDQVITMAADGISIDLNGFSLSGPVTCTGEGKSIDCTASGTGSGVGGSRRAISVRNGSIIGVGRFGVHLGDGSEVRNVRIRWAGIKGVVANGDVVISDNTVFENAGIGIECDGSCAIAGNVSRGNGSHGIEVNPGSVVRANSVSVNGEDGILCDGSLVHDNAVTFNTGWGLNWKGGIVRCGYRGNVIRSNAEGNVVATVVLTNLGGNLQ